MIIYKEKLTRPTVTEKMGWSYAYVYHDIPFHVGKINDDVGSDDNETPAWLVALNKALSEKTEDSWKAYILAAKENNISEKSVVKTCETLGINVERERTERTGSALDELLPK